MQGKPDTGLVATAVPDNSSPLILRHRRADTINRESDGEADGSCLGGRLNKPSKRKILDIAQEVVRRKNAYPVCACDISGSDVGDNHSDIIKLATIVRETRLLSCSRKGSLLLRVMTSFAC